MEKLDQIFKKSKLEVGALAKKDGFIAGVMLYAGKETKLMEMEYLQALILQ